MIPCSPVPIRNRRDPQRRESWFQSARVSLATIKSESERPPVSMRAAEVHSNLAD